MDGLFRRLNGTSDQGSSRDQSAAGLLVGTSTKKSGFVYDGEKPSSMVQHHHQQQQQQHHPTSPSRYYSKLQPAMPQRKKVIPGDLPRRGKDWLEISSGDNDEDMNPVPKALRSMGIYTTKSPSGLNPHFVVETILAQNRCTIETLEQIERDLPRTYPDVDFFSNTDVRDGLGRMLRAVAVEYPEVGYVQGMNFLGANILLHTEGNEDQAFLLFRNMMENPKYNLLHVFKPDLPNLRRFSDVMESFLNEKYPELYVHFHMVGLEPLFYSQNWIMTLFAYMVPFKPLAEIWDRFFQRGWETIFKVSLAFFHINLDLLLRTDFEGCAQILRATAEDPPGSLIEIADQISFTPEQIDLIQKTVAMEDIEIPPLTIPATSNDMNSSTLSNHHHHHHHNRRQSLNTIDNEDDYLLENSILTERSVNNDSPSTIRTNDTYDSTTMFATTPTQLFRRSFSARESLESVSSDNLMSSRPTFRKAKSLAFGGE